MAGYAGSQHLELMKRLNASTKNGNTDWSETDRPYSYICALAGAQILVSSRDDDGAAPFVLEILDSDGVIVDSVHPDDNTQGMALLELYERARRSATKADEILGRILNELPPVPSQGFSDEPPF